MATGWVYVINDGSGVPRIVRSRPAAGVAVARRQAGHYIVSFPNRFRRLTCIATLGNSVGVVMARPGSDTDPDANQVSVRTLTLNNTASDYDFSLAVFY